MNEFSKTCTYQGCQKIDLDKIPDQIGVEKSKINRMKKL